MKTYGIINPKDPLDILVITADFGEVLTLCQAGLEYREIENCDCCGGRGVKIKEVSA